MEQNKLEEDCDQLYQALKKFMADDETIIRITMKNNKQKRQKLKLLYKEKYFNNLEDDFSKKLSGYFKKTILALYDNQSDFDAKQINKALKLITNYNTLIEIICTRENSFLKQIKNSYKKLFNEDLEKPISNLKNTNLQKLFLLLLKCERHENQKNIDENNMKNIAQDFFNFGNGRWINNDDYINKIFTELSPNEFISFSNFFYEISKNSLRKYLEKEFNKDYQNALITIYESIACPSEFFAKQINKSIKGIGTKDKMLIRVLVYREEIDIPQIRIIYKNLIGKELIDDIKGDTHGSYRKILMEIASKKY